jgi:hypothetical protein
MTAFTNDYDKWNVIYGPWAYGAPYADGWYTRSTMFGARAGVYRLEEARAGLFAGYRPYFGDVAAGIDAHLMHFPFPKSEAGVIADMSVARFLGEDDYRPDRAVAYIRHILQQTSSLYWFQREFIDNYVAFQNNWMPNPRQQIGEKVNPMTTIGTRYFRESYVPYWTGARFRLDGNVALDYRHS